MKPAAEARRHRNHGGAGSVSGRSAVGELVVLKFIGGTMGIIFLIGLIIVIGLLMLIF